MNFYTDNGSLSFYLHHPDMDQVIAVRENDYAQAGQHPEAPVSAEEALAQYDMALDLLGGIKGITSDDCSFARGELTVDWRIPAGVIGFGRFHLNGGAILGSVPYPLLKLHEGNQSQLFGNPVVKLTDRSAFSMMNYYEYGSDRWLTGFYEHNFNGLLFGIIPLVKQLDLREVVTVRGAWGTISEQNRSGAPFRLMEGLHSLETPYVEAGIGVANIFHLFRVDCMWKLTQRNGRDFAVCIGLDIDL